MFAVVLLGLPPLLHLVKADLLGLLLIWGAAATLIRSRGSAFDKLMVSGVTLIGWTCVLGLIASYWPWGIQPLALTELTAAVLVALRAVRGPAPAGALSPRTLLPVRDVPLLVSSALVSAFALYPVLTRNATERLALIVTGEDLGRHVALYDTILRLGGLTSLHQGAAAETVTQGLATYPEGSHLTLAVLTSFLHGGPTRGAAMDQISLFVLLYTVMFAALAVAILWAVQRAAGPALRGWRGFALMLPVAAFLAITELPKLYFNGFLSELFALGLLAVLVALAIRPLNRLPEQVAALSALTVGVSFGHYLLLPAAGITVLGWAAVHWRVWRKHWIAVLAVSVVTGALALFPAYVNSKTANSDALTLTGGIGPVNRRMLFPLVALTLAMLLTPAARANRARRVALVSGGGIVALCYGLMRYQAWKVGGTTYFYEKMLHQLLVIGLVTMAAALLPAFGRRVLAGGRPTGRRLGLPAGLRSGLAVLAATGVLLFGVVFESQPDTTASYGWEGSPGRGMARGAQSRWDVAHRVASIDRSRPADDHKVAVSLLGHRAYGDSAADWGSVEDNLWLGVLNRDQGRSWVAWYWAISHRSAEEILDYAAKSPEPLRFYIDDPKLLADVRALAAKGKHPGLDVSQVKRNTEGEFVVEPLTFG
ncbi:hypothetical protein ACIBCA_24935 [Kitasatospora sp. NPDC051170]|uniref:hypothetical protein n=1 Tax=Kitasatospora sp. NPDC051170 TaxID=3364056 RepID=UPI0037990D5D